MKKKSSNKKSLTMYVIIAAATFIVAFFITYSIFSLISFDEITFSIEILKNKLIYSVAGIAALVTLIGSVIYSIYHDMFGTSKLLNKAEDAKSGIYGSARWLSEKEIKNKFGYYNYYDLYKKDISGYVIQSVRKRNNLFFSVIPKVHALNVGITGDGKSLRYIGMCLQLNAKSKTKASMLINDSKGELFDKHSRLLKEEGYEVIAINLRNTESSKRFNYMSLIWDLHMDALNTPLELTPDQLNQLFDNHLSNKQKNQENELGLIKLKNEFYDNWKDKQLKLQASKKQRAEVLTLELARILVPDGTGENRQWTDGAQGICAGIIVAMLEDAEYPGPGKLGITKEKFCIEQISNIVNNQRESFFDFLQLRPGDSKVFQYCGNIVGNSSSKTVDSYLSTLSTSLRIYLERGISYLLSSSDIDLKTIITKPTAIFIIVADEYPSRYVVSTMIISQLYNELINQSNNYERQTLPRPFYFMLDEMGNLPKIPGLETWITISKSRNIFFNLIVQAISQIEAKYGKENSKTILQNCHLQILMGTNEAQTAKHFQEMFGTRTIVKRSANYNPKTVSTSYQGSSSLEKVDLISFDKLFNMPVGSIYWKMTKTDPARSNLSIIYDVEDIINLGKIDVEEPYRPLYNNFYNIEERNNVIKGRNKKKIDEDPDAKSKKSSKPKQNVKQNSKLEKNMIDIISPEASHKDEEMPNFHIFDFDIDKPSSADKTEGADNEDLHKTFFNS